MSQRHLPYKLKARVKMMNSGSLKALATVTIDDVIETHGWKIMESNRMHEDFQEEIWIQPPSIASNGRQRNAIYIGDKTMFKGFESVIYDAFSLKRSQTEDSNKGPSSEDIANDIPF